MDLLAYTSYNSKSYSTSKSSSSSSNDSGVGGVVFVVIVIVLIIIGIANSSHKKQVEEQRRKEWQAKWEAERKQREAEEARKKAEEEKRKAEELRRKKEQERLRRQAAQAEFERRKVLIDKQLERKIVEVDESYSKLYKFQKQSLSDMYISGKKFCILPTGAGKTAVMFNWLKYMDPKKVLIVTTASKRDSGDFEKEANIWCGAGWKESLSSFEIISWHGLSKWYYENYGRIDDYVFAFDEVHNAGAGLKSNMGAAFLKITYKTDKWTGYTATPGDEWKKFAPYFIATGKVRNNTSFEAQYTYKRFGRGYAYIAGYIHEDELEEMWRDISTTPDASSVFNELPSETEETIHFDRPSGYETLLRNRISDDGKYLDSIMALCHALRQKCCTKQKINWVSDFVDGLETNAVFFYNYIAEGDQIVEALKKKIPKDAKIWRIDGRHHDIPTKSTLGPHDMVVAQYSSGSNSLNLQFIHHWVSFSPNYSYTLSIQAKGRIKRIGQEHAMFFYYFRTDNTIEDAIYKCLFNKEDFSEKVWAVEEGLTDEDMSED